MRTALRSLWRDYIATIEGALPERLRPALRRPLVKWALIFALVQGVVYAAVAAYFILLAEDDEIARLADLVSW